MRPSTAHAPFAPPLGALALVAALLFAGCLGPDETPRVADPTASEAPAVANVTAPDPVEIRGTALIPQPLHSAFCLRQGIDGGIHKLPERADLWWFELEPADEFVVFWWDETNYIGDGGTASGTVPEGSTHAEVCRTMGIGETYYTLTLVHPDHPDHPDHPGDPDAGA